MQFVEIEYGTDSVTTPGQKIKPLANDPIREKFYDMRSFAPDNPDTWGGAKLFYRQGKFMEKFSDDYEKILPLSMSIPTYQRLGYDQLRTYFTWRAKIQQGEFLPIPLSYLYLHIYELLCQIGVKTPIDGLDKLLNLWKTYQKTYPALNHDLPTWLKDYNVYHKLPFSFAKFIQTHNLHMFYHETNLFNFDPVHTLTNWAAVSGYDINSEFYTDSNRELMQNSFYSAVVAVHKHLENRGKSIASLFYHSSNFIPWHPFAETVFSQSSNQPDQEVQISMQEIYVCKNNKWTTRKITPHVYTNNLAGFLILLMETNIRTLLDYKGNAPKNRAKFNNAVKSLSDKGIRELSGIFEVTAKEAHQKLTRIVVTVDTQNLSRIREEAEVTQEKLIVEDSPLNIVKPAITTPFLSTACPATAMPAPSVTPPSSVETEIRQPESTDPWLILKSTLTTIELKALKIILHTPDNIKAFANENGIMLEILADGINEKAMDTIGDNILELSDIVIIYDEYIQQIESII